jgi:alpha-galactosidase/6-phospho-beta-glucosidase family protein
MPRERKATDGRLDAGAMYDCEGIKRALGLGDLSLLDLRCKAGLNHYEVGNRVLYDGGEIIEAIKRLSGPRAKRGKQGEQTHAQQNTEATAQDAA